MLLKCKNCFQKGTACSVSDDFNELAPLLEQADMVVFATIEAARLSKEQKRELVASLTKSASSIMNIPEQAYVVIVKENETDNIGVGGVLLSEKGK